eukprot:1098767-Alexandrium_andersonii.AAC.1
MQIWLRIEAPASVQSFRPMTRCPLAPDLTSSTTYSSSKQMRRPNMQWWEAADRARQKHEMA